MTDTEYVTVAEVVEASKHLSPDEMQAWMAGLSLDGATDPDEAGEQLASWRDFRTGQASEMQLGVTQLRKEAASLEVARRMLKSEGSDAQRLLPATINIGKPCTGKGHTPSRQPYFDFRDEVETTLGVPTRQAGRIATALTNTFNLNDEYFSVEEQADGTRTVCFRGGVTGQLMPDDLFIRPRMVGTEMHHALLRFLQIVGERQATLTD